MLVKGWIWRNVPGVLDFVSDFDFFSSNIYFSHQPESQLLYASPAETACKFYEQFVKITKTNKCCLLFASSRSAVFLMLN
jgi:hypothetical protein